MGLSTSLLELNKREEKEVKLRKVSKTKRLSSEQIADLFNVTAGVSIMYIIPSASLLQTAEQILVGDPAVHQADLANTRQRKVGFRQSISVSIQTPELSRDVPTSSNQPVVFVLALKKMTRFLLLNFCFR